VKARLEVEGMGATHAYRRDTSIGVGGRKVTQEKGKTEGDRFRVFVVV